MSEIPGRGVRLHTKRDQVDVVLGATFVVSRQELEGDEMTGLSHRHAETGHDLHDLRGRNDLRLNPR